MLELVEELENPIHALLELVDELLVLLPRVGLARLVLLPGIALTRFMIIAGGGVPDAGRCALPAVLN